MSDPDAPLRHAVDSGALACVAAMAATSKGVIHAGAFGLRNPQAGAAMTTDSVGWIASMTKAVVSVAALRLVEQGRLSLDEPICDVLPELTGPSVLERFGTDGAPVLRPAETPISLRHLLTHTAGYGYDTWNPALWHLQERLGLPRIPTSPEGLRAVPLLFEPGTRWNYGINIDLVGRAIEVVSGQTLEAHLRETLTGPLGMDDTMALIGPAQQARRVVLQQRGADGLAPVAWRAPERLAFLYGGGGLYSSAADYLTFLRAVLGGTLLGPAMQAELTRNQIGDLDVQPMLSAVPTASNDVHLFPGQRLKWTLAFLQNTQTTAEGRSAGSLAWAGLSNCYYWIDPARDVCGVFVTGLLPFADPAALAAFAGYEAEIYRSLNE
jgi:CubicO group peptidase (beta-lactamase class C family)